MKQLNVSIAGGHEEILICVALIQEFIEFFITSEKLPELLRKLTQDPYITYYAANRKGECKTNVVDRESQNAVTWGVFPGKEIVQTTIIEQVSFDAWRVS